MRLMKRMKSGVRALLVIVLAGTLASSALACPLWMGSLTICLASPSYLMSDVDVSTPLLTELPGEVAGASVLGTSLRGLEPIQQYDSAPPGPSSPLFLRTHSLLI